MHNFIPLPLRSFFQYRYRFQFISSLLVVALFLNVILPAYAQEKVDFTDVPRISPYFLAVQHFKGTLIKGYSDGTFRPDHPINRAEALKIILKDTEVETPPVPLEQKLGLPFLDVNRDDWFLSYVVRAYEQKIIAGNDKDRSFAPGRQVNKAEFLKMLFLANKTDLTSVSSETVDIKDVPRDAWFAPYLHYALSLGIIEKDNAGFVYPARPLSRGEALQILYLFTFIKKGKDTQFLLDRTEDELTQIEVYIAANRVDLAKRSSTLAVDLSQQALKNMSDNNVVLGAAKLARAYDLLVDSYVLGLERKKAESAAAANQAIAKATEAWEANAATQPIARHIKERAREILAQVGGEEIEVTIDKP